MAGITLDQAQAQLDTWMAALSTIAERGQSYTVNTGGGSRTLTRANLREVQEQVTYWDTQCKRLSRGGMRVRGAVPHG